MKTPKVAVLATLLLLLVGWSNLSAQAFFPNRVKGTLEVKFLPPAGGQGVQVSIDDQLAGVLPLTVYVLPGAHRFTFFSGDESKTITYPVRGDVVVPSIFTPKGFPLTVNTNVPGASLAVDGSGFAGNSTTVTPGNHTLTVSAPGYQVLNMPFNQPTSANTINVTLIGNSFPLTVNVNPAGAALAVDGRPFAGNQTSVAPGNHTLTVNAPGYQSLTLPFNQPSSANILNITLISNTFPLTVNVNPAGAALAVDGRPFAGNQTSVAPGNHTLTVSAPGYQALTLPFSQPSSANILNITLIANTFPLTVNVNPAGAALAIDGSPFAGNQTSVAPGNHTLTVSAPGYQSLTLPFSQPSSANILNITLIASTGTLQVNTERLPRTGQPYRLFVNGTEARGGLQTLMPGSYSIRITSGNLSLETTVTVASGQALTLTPTVQWELR